MKINFKTMSIWQIIAWVILMPCGIILFIWWLWSQGYIQKAYYYVVGLFSGNKQSYTVDTTENTPKSLIPIGIRLNNPLNIKYAKSNDWQGQIGFEETTDGRVFAKFVNMVKGARAGLSLIRTYINMYQLRTIAGIVNRWENGTGSATANTENYINFVAQNSGIPRDKILDPNDMKSLTIIAHNMAKFENGGNFVELEVFTRGWVEL